MTAPVGVVVRPMAADDADAVLRIYQAGMDGGLASFETAAPAWEAFDAGKLPGHRFVAELDGTVVGWVAVSQVSARAVYAGVVEHSVYVDPHARGRGIGLVLLEALLASTDAAGIWTVQSAVFPDNAASLRLHQRAGFRVIGSRERISRRRGLWCDTLLIERRSPVVGSSD
ncbi:MAG TPA: GNAT family N-acetyltransferase [Actinocrinis sp.]|nr:GNAT family N-acetyltransferase [Actinocrinis sp.]